jgi:hypothetical protein
MKMETASSSETLIITYQITRRHNTENKNINIQRRENLKPYIYIFYKWVTLCIAEHNSLQNGFRDYQTKYSKIFAMFSHIYIIWHKRIINLTFKLFL